MKRSRTFVRAFSLLLAIMDRSRGGLAEPLLREVPLGVTVEVCGSSGSTKK